MGVDALAHALADHGAVVWEPPERPRLRVAPQWVEPLRADARVVRAVLTRAAVFRRQWLDADRGPTVPLLVIPGVQAGDGQCFSCGDPLPLGRAWRCVPCLVAVYVALDRATRLPEVLGELGGDAD